MSGLVFGCIAPHGGMLIPGIDGPDGRKARATRAAMEELGRRVEAHRPDTIALITPHGTSVPDAFSLLDSGRVAGELGGNGRSVTVEFRVDNELNAAIAALGDERGVPVKRIVRGNPEDPSSCLPLDWGAVIPFWFMGRGMSPPPRVVVAAPHYDLDWNLYSPFGEIIRVAAEGLGRRLAIIASADLGHAHDPRGPYGYDPAAAEFDAVACEAIRQQDLGRMLHLDRDWVERAKIDALWQMLNLHGAIDGQGFRGELLSYEVPTYFGMLCAAYERVG
jgi:aromatic ring-opening dioxygenase LigB subunit